MNGLAHRTVDTNSIRMHVAEQGEGPLVLLCHGFPESWYSWRHQLPALAQAGFRAVAPDMRGYGRTDQPREIDQYTVFHLVGDMVGLLDALAAPRAVIAGHDWGALVAWHAALMRPDRFHAVIGLSVPYWQRGPARPTTLMPQTEDAVFYQLYLQTPDLPEAEIGRDVRRYLRSVLFANSGNNPHQVPKEQVGMVPRHGGLAARLASQPANPPSLPAWLTEADVDFFAAEFGRTGFRGALNYYRNIDRNWELLAPFAGATVSVPALYVAGDRDLVLAFRGMDQLVPNLVQFVPRLRRTIILPGCGHWTQQERAAAVNTAMIEFLRGL
ncbi:MAG TPA: alpha/beta hydrolase [Stellaceae bacterium]|nr:alpha/beta hydrolase [Stellaceae bacterium]